MDEIASFMLAVLLILLLLPWAIIVAVAILARDHFRKFMPWYIGGAFAVEILMFILLFGAGAVV